MFKLKPGQTLNQEYKVDQTPYISQFVKQTNLSKQPEPEKKSPSVIIFGK